MSAVTITNENFQNEVMHADKPVLLDFWAPWCGPCRMVSPVVEEIAAEHPDIKVGKVNVDEQPALAAQVRRYEHPDARRHQERPDREPGRGSPPQERDSESAVRRESMGFLDFLKRPGIDQGVEEYQTVPGAVLLDVRTREEYREGRIPGSENLAPAGDRRGWARGGR